MRGRHWCRSWILAIKGRSEQGADAGGIGRVGKMEMSEEVQGLLR